MAASPTPVEHPVAAPEQETPIEVPVASPDSASVDFLAPEGWEKKLAPLKKGRTAKRRDVYYIAPSGEEIKTRKQLERYLKSHPGGPAASEFDWTTGETPRRSARLSSKTRPSTDSPEAEPGVKRAKRQVVPKDKVATEEKLEVEAPSTEDSPTKVGEEEVMQDIEKPGEQTPSLEGTIAVIAEANGECKEEAKGGEQAEEAAGQEAEDKAKESAEGVPNETGNDVDMKQEDNQVNVDEKYAGQQHESDEGQAQVAMKNCIAETVNGDNQDDGQSLPSAHGFSLTEVFEQNPEKVGQPTETDTGRLSSGPVETAEAGISSEPADLST